MIALFGWIIFFQHQFHENYIFDGTLKKTLGYFKEDSLNSHDLSFKTK
jgi:hypothetical protein